jgi:hypothetical protein
MVNEYIVYPEDVRNATRQMYDYIHRDYPVEIMLGDTNGPSRYAMAIKVPFRRSFVVLECNTGSWRISFHDKSDEAATHGIIFNTKFTNADVENFYEAVLREFFASLI